MPVNEGQIIRAPGKLFRGVTSTDPANRATNFGGTFLGASDGFYVRAGLSYAMNHAQERAGVDKVFLVADNPRVAVVIREWSAAGLSAFFPSSSAGIVTIPGGIPSGSVLAPSNFLWAADNDQNPSVIIPSGIPMVEATEQGLRFTQLHELNLFGFILCRREHSGDYLTIRKLGA
jgi:hypothetical protein